VHAQTVRNERAYGCLRPVVAKSDGGIRLWRSHARAVRPQQKAREPGDRVRVSVHGSTRRGGREVYTAEC
jgi:hypothetical protein